MSEFLTPLKIFVSEIHPTHSDAAEMKNLSYLLNIIHLLGVRFHM